MADIYISLYGGGSFDSLTRVFGTVVVREGVMVKYFLSDSSLIRTGAHAIKHYCLIRSFMAPQEYVAYNSSVKLLFLSVCKIHKSSSLN